MRRVLLAALAFAAVGCASGPKYTPPPPAPAPMVAPAPSGEVGLETWNANHPQAASELCRWANNHPNAAHKFFTWDANHPERSQELVFWALANPGLGVDAFVATHPNWPGFDRLAEKHRPATDTFLAWARRHPNAARALMNRRGGLAWAGNHLAC